VVWLSLVLLRLVVMGRRHRQCVLVVFMVTESLAQLMTRMSKVMHMGAVGIQRTTMRVTAAVCLVWFTVTSEGGDGVFDLGENASDTTGRWLVVVAAVAVAVRERAEGG